MVYMMDSNGFVTPVDSDSDEMEVWGRWVSDIDNRVIAKTELVDPSGKVYAEVSTVFLAMDHSFGEEGDPVLFETIVFGLNDDRMRRDTNLRDSVVTHVRVARAIMMEEAYLTPRWVVRHPRVGFPAEWESPSE